MQQYLAHTPRCTKCALALSATIASTAPLLCGACLQADHLTHIDTSFAVVSYAFPWQDIINQFKFNNAIGYCNTLAHIMLNHSVLAHAFARNNLVIPMPLHTSRLAERGYNQSLLLARSLCKQVRAFTHIQKNQCLLKANYLERIRATAVQNQLPLQSRKHNVCGAFAVPKNRKKLVSNQHVALVDDVLTTGASANAAAQALRNAGAKTVTVFIFARTEKDKK